MAIAAVTDIRTGKIPNKLTFPGAALGIFLQLLAKGPLGALWGVEGWVVGVGSMLAIKMFLRQFGFGDVKLIGAIGACLGPWLALLSLFYFSFWFGAWSLSRLLLSLPWKQLLLVLRLAGSGASLPASSLERFNQVRKSTVPVGPFIAAGTVCALLLEHQTRQFLGFR